MNFIRRLQLTGGQSKHPQNAKLVCTGRASEQLSIVADISSLRENAEAVLSEMNVQDSRKELQSMTPTAEVEKIFKSYMRLILATACIFVVLLAFERKSIDERNALKAEIERQQAIENIVPEPINRIPMVMANKPADYKPPVYDWQTKTQICYPEVIERQMKEEKRRNAYKLEKWRAYHADGIVLDYDELG